MITGVILARNEERHVVDCVAALRPHVSEILLIDMESEDRTVELATPIVDRILSHPLVPNFDSARNIAIPVAQCDWLWFVDADERIPELTGRTVNQWIQEQGNNFEAINIPFKSYFCGRWMRHCGWWPGYTCPRVLKRGYFEFSRQLHGGVKLTGREVRFPASAETGVEHYSFRDLNHYVEKFNRYTSTEALQLAEQGIVYDWRGALRFMVHDLWEHYEKHNARLDGERGWILTWMASQYRWMSVAKLLDHGKSSEQTGGPSSVPRDLDEFVLALEEELASFRTQDPQPPFGIVWRSALWDTTRAAAESRAAITQLSQEARAITVEALPGQNSATVTAETSALLKALGRTRRSHSVVTLTQMGAFVVPPDRCACFNVLRVLDDCSISADAVPNINAYDEIWVEAETQLRSLCVLGIASERLRVVPLMDHKFAVEAVPSLDEMFRIEEELCRIEKLLDRHTIPASFNDQTHVQLEGEFFSGHSFSNINEQLALRLAREPSLALSLHNVQRPRVSDQRALSYPRLTPYFRAADQAGLDVVVRHAFPPDWRKPTSGRWVHIQPWEFGSLPKDWLPTLRDEVDEIWVMSKYVERVYLDSGVSPAKLQYIPWGIDPDIFKPEAPPRKLATEKTFRFLYVGGTILRKGFDRVLSAYLAEFGPEDDVCLVIKDVGVDSFYAPQTMRDEITKAMQDPNAAAIVYLTEEMTAGQLASLYTACDCLVAPYRGEGFGLPVLEALACGVPPIVPTGGPTDDFVDHESGFLMPSLIVPAAGVANLSGPATELHVSPDDLRETMRRAYTNRDHAKQLGMAGSERVRREFTWNATVQKMVDRLHALSEEGAEAVASSPELSLQLPSQSSANSRLTLVVTEVTEANGLIDTLASLRPFLTTAVVLYDGADPCIPSIAQEYGATVVRSADEPLSLDGDWVLLLKAGESLPLEDPETLGSWLGDIPTSVDHLCFNLTNANHSKPQSNELTIRLSRWSEPRSISQLIALASTDVEPARPLNVMRASLPLHVRKASLETEQLPSKKTESDDYPLPAAISPIYGRLGKSVLIQMATGPHLELLDITREHHHRYAERHGMDYWCVNGNPVRDKRAGWGKIPLLLAGIKLGYETVIWLDSDAVIVQPDIDLSSLVADGIGMVRHPRPQHWNTGLIIARASEEVEQFWQLVDAAPENNSAWMEQYAANELAAQSQFAPLMRPLDLRYNSVPGYAMAESPVIVAAHGLPMPERQSILKNALEGVAFQATKPESVQLPVRRDDFGRFLNDLGLCGEAVEVGVLRGDFSRSILDRWHGRLLHLVDPWQHQTDYHDISNLSDADFERCLGEVYGKLQPHEGRFRVHRIASPQAAENFADASLDFAYLDANHSFSAVNEDLRHWYPKLKSGGILAGHDYLDGELPEGSFGVASAVNTFARERDLELRVTQEPAWKSWYLFKP